MAHGRFYGLRGAHIDAGKLQDIDGVLAGAGREERQIGVPGRVAAAQHFIDKRMGCADAGSVLVDVEVVIEMGNPGPFDIRLVVDVDVGTEILHIKLAVFGFEKGRGQWNPLLGKLVQFELKFCEHGLSDERCAHIVELLIDQEGLLLLAGCPLEEVAEQELFVEGRCDLSDKDRVLGVLEGLTSAA